MKTLMPTSTLSPAMAAVLRWLLAYPELHLLGNYRDGTVPWLRWTASWASEAHRQHMQATMTMLGSSPATLQLAQPRVVREGATPRCTTQTYEALRRRGMIRPVKQEMADGVPVLLYYQLSQLGIRALHRLAVQETASDHADETA